MGSMVVEAPLPTVSPTSRRRLLGLFGFCVVAAAIILLYLHSRRVPSESNAYPASWFMPTSQDPATLIYPIAMTTHTPEWSQFQSGDGIVITSVKGDRKGVDVGGRYLIEGIYTLASMDTARLTVSVTAKRGGIGGISPVHPEEGTSVHRGTGHFSIIATMRYPGTFHVSFNLPGGGESRGSVYFDESVAPQPASSTPLPTPNALFTTQILVGVEANGSVSVDGKGVSAEELEPLLAKAYTADANTTVLIKCDDATDPKKLGLVFDACRQAGVKKFSLQAR